MNFELFINWNPSLTFGPFRWYSLCWLIGLTLAYFIVRKLFKEQKIDERTVKKNGRKETENVFDPLFIYCFLGILIGARLGHCLFYQPDYFLSSGKHIIEMFIPIHFMADGSWKFTGYEGLASHGGTLGLIIALILYVRWSKLNVWTVLDNIAIATGTTACFIRLGNLMNSEIIGKPTDVPWAFIFERVDMVPRHPGQLYEAIAYAILFFLMWYLYKKSRKGIPQNLKPGQSWMPESSIPQVGTASSSSTPRTFRRISKPTCSSIWVRFSPSPSSSSGLTACSKPSNELKVSRTEGANKTLRGMITIV